MKTLNISYIFDKTLILPVICDKCGSNDEKIVKEEESINILKIIDSIIIWMK